MIQKKEYMARCFNKARPMLHCDGKCQLMKKLEEQENKEQGLPPELKLAAQYDLLSGPQSIFNLSQQYLMLENGFAIIYRIGNPIDQPSAVFHPPAPGTVISPA